MVKRINQDIAFLEHFIAAVLLATRRQSVARVARKKKAPRT